MNRSRTVGTDRVGLRTGLSRHQRRRAGSGAAYPLSGRHRGSRLVRATGASDLAAPGRLCTGRRRSPIAGSRELVRNRRATYLCSAAGVCRLTRPRAALGTGRIR